MTARVRGSLRNVCLSCLMWISSIFGGLGSESANGSCWNIVSFVWIKKLFRCTGLDTFKPRKNLKCQRYFLAGGVAYFSMAVLNFTSQIGTGPWILHNGHPMRSEMYQPAGAMEKLACLRNMVSLFVRGGCDLQVVISSILP